MIVYWCSYYYFIEYWAADDIFSYHTQLNDTTSIMKFVWGSFLSNILLLAISLTIPLLEFKFTRIRVHLDVHHGIIQTQQLIYQQIGIGQSIHQT